MSLFKKLFGSKKRYVCSECGKEHDDWPALTFISPDSYCGLNDDEKNTIAEIDKDFCVIRHSDQTDRFIRVTFTQFVNNNCEDLEYGVWVSLSKKSFNDYLANFDNPDHEVSYFGYLCNAIPEYENTASIHTTVFTRKGDSRPYIIPHKDFAHRFVKDYYAGISKAEAEKRIKTMMKRTNRI